MFAFTGLTSVFVGLQEAGSSLAHATGACLYSVVFLQVYHPADRILKPYSTLQAQISQILMGHNHVRVVNQVIVTAIHMQD